jgi:hypothetical protein
MLYKLTLKNARKTALIDESGYDYITKNSYLEEIDFLKNLRLHSNGYVFFQKHWRQLDGSYKVETIYLQKVLAEKFLEKPDPDKRFWVRFKNGDKLDYRIDNLEWSTLSNVVRNTKKTENQTGYRGVVKSGKKYMAIIYKNRKGIHLGTFTTAEEAAMAYNSKSIELFGETRSLNKLRIRKK